MLKKHFRKHFRKIFWKIQILIKCWQILVKILPKSNKCHIRNHVRKPQFRKFKYATKKAGSHVKNDSSRFWPHAIEKDKTHLPFVLCCEWASINQFIWNLNQDIVVRAFLGWLLLISLAQYRNTNFLGKCQAKSECN